MKKEELNNETLSAFIVRQSSGAFLCRHRNCSRAAQGFRTLELREKHEESHRPRFQCAHAPCGFFGATYNSRAAMKQHAAQYHDEEATDSIPNSLSRRPHGLHEDKSLFAFTEVKTRRRVEDFSPRENVEMATDVSPKYSQTTLAFEGARETPVTPSNATISAFSHLVQVANAGRSEASRQQPSPFRENSQFAKETNTYPSFSTDDLRSTSTTPLERHPEQRNPEGNTHVFEPPKTLRPKEMLQNYDSTEEDTTPLFSSAPPLYPTWRDDSLRASASYGQSLDYPLDSPESSFQESRNPHQLDRPPPVYPYIFPGKNEIKLSAHSRTDDSWIGYGYGWGDIEMPPRSGLFDDENKLREVLERWKKR